MVRLMNEEDHSSTEWKLDNRRDRGQELAVTSAVVRKSGQILPDGLHVSHMSNLHGDLILFGERVDNATPTRNNQPLNEPPAKKRRI